MTRAKYEVAFTVPGDFNRTDYTETIDLYGACTSAWRWEPDRLQLTLLHSVSS